MEFENRIKKELTEGVIRAILIDAGYRLIDSGVENIIREITCLTSLEYLGLDIPKAIRSMPDFIVLDKEQKNKYLVEVKYRANWDNLIFIEIEEQVKLFKELILIYFNSNPQLIPGKPTSPSAFIRCCRMRYYNDEYQIELKKPDIEINWFPVADLNDNSWVWWGFQPLQNIFPLVNKRKDEATLLKAINSLQGIINI